VSAIPPANKRKNSSAIRSIDLPRPRSVPYIIYSSAILPVAPCLDFFSVEYLTLPMFAKRARSWYFTA
jgi:hypothetical protein